MGEGLELQVKGKREEKKERSDLGILI